MALAALVCFFILAVTLPNLGGSDLAHGVRYRWPDFLTILIIIAPLALVIIGAACSPVTERIGWVLLVLLFAIRIYG